MFKSTVFAACVLALALSGCKSEDPPASEETTTPTSNETKVVPETTHVAVDSEGHSSAVAVLVPVADSGVAGVISFTRDGDVIHVTGEVTGLTPGKHAFHVHEFGDVCNTENGSSAGGHFNPDGHEHGRPSDENRHAGDLGNIEANEDGVATIDIEDSVIALTGTHNVLGRTIVIHAGEDQFTQPSGDAGARVAIGVIGLSNSAE